MNRPAECAIHARFDALSSSLSMSRRMRRAAHERHAAEAEHRERDRDRVITEPVARDEVLLCTVKVAEAQLALAEVRAQLGLYPRVRRLVLRDEAEIARQVGVGGGEVAEV